MKKRVLASILAGVLTVGVLTGCGSKTEEAADTTATEETTEDAAEDKRPMQQQLRPKEPLL